MSDGIESSLRTIQELTAEEKIDLVTGQDNRVVQILFKVMENEIIFAKDAAVDALPSDPKRLALLNEAHFIKNFVRNIREVVNTSLQELQNSSKVLAVEADLNDPDKQLEIMLNQTANLNLL